MSKYTNGALQVLETADKDINQTFGYTEETNECVFCSTRRESGWVTVEKSGIISKIGEASLLRWVLQPVIFFGT